MNCFHFSVSLGYKTTRRLMLNTYPGLWIAFIFQYLWDTKQHDEIFYWLGSCCELLSFFSIFGIQNNNARNQLLEEYVVNCFHFSVSLGYKTTWWIWFRVWRLLWIAFIFQYLWDTKQQIHYKLLIMKCCELLSFFSIFGIQNNALAKRAIVSAVVNCFHFSVSLGYKTTIRDNYFIENLLWIAFIFQYLWDTKQP